MFKVILSILFTPLLAFGTDVKISNLPLGTGSTTNASDSFPYVSYVNGVTKRLAFSDILNIPSIATPTFTGTVTAPLFVGALTGVASGNASYSANNHGVMLSGVSSVMTVLAPDSSASKVLKSGGASANPSWLAYDNANTVSTLVARDGSGNFSAGTITAALTGAASGNLSATANQYGLVTSGAANVATVIAPDASATKWLKSGGASAVPAWTAHTGMTVQRFTTGTAATYTKPSAAVALKVLVLGGGGAGGGGAATGGANGTAAGGGAGGGWSMSWISSPSATYTYTVGAGGTPGTAGNNNGNNGGNSTFSYSSMVGTGGTGGAGSNTCTGPVFCSAQAGPSLGTGGDLVGSGSFGAAGTMLGSSGGQLLSGRGGDSLLGTGGTPCQSCNGNGTAGNGYGSGGSGSGSGNNLAAFAGGAGTGGIIIVEEYY